MPKPERIFPDLFFPGKVPRRQKRYDQGVDIIFAAAAAKGSSDIHQAQKSGKFVIGVDADQDAVAPGHVLTSVMKREAVLSFGSC